MDNSSGRLTLPSSLGLGREAAPLTQQVNYDEIIFTKFKFGSSFANLSELRAGCIQRCPPFAMQKSFRFNSQPKATTQTSEIVSKDPDRYTHDLAGPKWEWGHLIKRDQYGWPHRRSPCLCLAGSSMAVTLIKCCLVSFYIAKFLSDEGPQSVLVLHFIMLIKWVGITTDPTHTIHWTN